MSPINPHNGETEGIPTASRPGLASPGGESRPGKSNRPLVMVVAHAGQAKPLMACLEEHGCDALLFSTLQEAAEHLQNLSEPGPYPRLALLQIKPENQGDLAFLPLWKQSSLSRQIPVVVLLHTTDATRLRAAYQAHANCVLTEPASEEEFCRVMAACMNFWLEIAMPSPLVVPQDLISARRRAAGWH